MNKIKLSRFTDKQLDVYMAGLELAQGLISEALAGAKRAHAAKLDPK